MYKSFIYLSQDHPTSNAKLEWLQNICEIYSAFNGISHYKLFAILLPNRWVFLSDDLIT